MPARLAPMPIARPTTIVLAVLAIAVATTAAGCGSSDESETSAPPASSSTTPGQEAPIGVRAKSCDGTGSSGDVRVTGVSCELGRSLVAGWHRNGACSGREGASRLSCRLGRFICIGAITDRGVAVTCAAPGRSVAFLAREPG
jgi:hypothetical protein